MLTNKELRAVRRYQKLLPTHTSITDNDRELIRKATAPMRVVLSHKDKMRPLMLFSLLQKKTLQEIEVLSIYDLIDIYLGKDMRYRRLLDILPDVLIVYAGYDEFPNKQLENAFIQVSENIRAHNKSLWLYYKGTHYHMKARYPSLTAYLERVSYEVLELDKGQAGELEEEL